MLNLNRRRVVEWWCFAYSLDYNFRGHVLIMKKRVALQQTINHKIITWGNYDLLMHMGSMQSVTDIKIFFFN